MTHLELLDVSARLDQERDDQAACTLACRLVCLHAEAAHAVVVSRRGEAWCAIGADGDPGETAATLPHLCRPGAPDQVAGAQGWHVAQPVDEGGATVGWLVARWPTQAQARSGVDLLAAFARLVATRVVAPRLPCADPGLEEVLVGSSGLMHAVRQQLTLAARAPFPVLIRGESGCGKELAARAIHRLSARRHRRCAAINCAALPDDLVESELFGHVRGAFTGAATDRAGLFDDADGGTLFLDEVAELGARAQAKLLRVLQDGEVRRVGETQAHRVDVRVIAATNVALDRAVQAGTFRADLFYRLDVVRVHMPALRERREDIPQLTAHLWRDYAARVGCRARLDDSVVRALARHDWPGNVRELQNTLAALAVNAPVRGRVTLADLSTEWRARESNTAPGEADEPGGLDAARRAFDATFVREALCRAGGRPSAAARDLGLTRQGLTKLVRRLGLNPAAIGSRVP